MTHAPHTHDDSTGDSGWRALKRALVRSYPVTPSMLLLVSLIPLYLVIANHAHHRTTYTPILPVDRLFPVVPMWSLVYGALYFFLILLPLLIVQQKALIRRVVWSYLTVWLSAYVCFWFFPTVAPRPETVEGSGFAVWGLRFLYKADPPHNCFPSLHVAHSFVSALACTCVHRRLGTFSLVCASLVALSTLFTKQHYVADLLAGILLAFGAYWIFLRNFPRDTLPAFDRHVAPTLALFAGGLVGLTTACFWLAYLCS